MKTAHKSMTARATLWLLMSLGFAPALRAGFIHPDALHTQAGSDRMKGEGQPVALGGQLQSTD